MAVIFAKYGRERDIAATLLHLADDVNDVRTNTDSGLSFVVPEYLYEKYLAHTTVVDETPAGVDQAKRRPGRPRKALPALETEGE